MEAARVSRAEEGERPELIHSEADACRLTVLAPSLDLLVHLASFRLISEHKRDVGLLMIDGGALVSCGRGSGDKRAREASTVYGPLMGSCGRSLGLGCTTMSTRSEARAPR